MKLKLTVAYMEERGNFCNVKKRDHAGRDRNRVRGCEDVDWIYLAQ
jgi:hypothetical protein